MKITRNVEKDWELIYWVYFIVMEILILFILTFQDRGFKRYTEISSKLSNILLENKVKMCHVSLVASAK